LQLLAGNKPHDEIKFARRYITRDTAARGIGFGLIRHRPGDPLFRVKRKSLFGKEVASFNANSLSCWFDPRSFCLNTRI
jgi:hypothetical protein